MIDGIDLKRPRLNTLKQQLRQQQRPSSMTKTTEYLRSLLTATVLSITFLALLVYTSYTRDDLNSPASLLLRATTTSSKKLSAAELAKRDGPWPECVWMTGTECADHIRSFVEKDAHVFQLMDETDNTGNAVSTFDLNRIIIYVDNNDAVQQTPARG